MEESPVARKANFSIDLKSVLGIVVTGVRRTSAFLKLGLQSASLPPPQDFALDEKFTFRFWPNPVPEEVALAVRDEFSHWLTGACIKELDQCFSLFLDSIWFVLELGDIHGQSVPSAYEFDQRFPNATNVASKLGEVAKKIGIESEEQSFRSLSLARNALTHGAGRVRQRDMNAEGRLEVTWLSTEVVLQDGEKGVVLSSEQFDPYKVESPDGAEVLLRFVRRSLEFNEGEKVEFPPRVLAQLCFFYLQEARKVVRGTEAYLKAKGVVPAQTGAAKAAVEPNKKTTSED